MISKLLRAGRARILIYTAAALLFATLLDWAAGDDVSLAALYIVPVMLGAVVLRNYEMVSLAIACALLRAYFDSPSPLAERILRFIFAALSYWVSGLFVTGLVRNHQLEVAHLNDIRKEQSLRLEAEEQLGLLVESSPAAIFTLDRNGTVLTANESMNRLLFVGGKESLVGRSILPFLAFFEDALRAESKTIGLRTAVKCQARRANAEPFLADVWFSSYVSNDERRIAAIVVDASDDLREREEQGLVHLKTGNTIATAAIAHEVRNFCEGIALLSDDLRQRYSLGGDETLRGLESLVAGLERIAAFELQTNRQEEIRAIDLNEVLGNLRIVIEPEWREIDGHISWRIPASTPAVMGEATGLLQAFLNLAKNSCEAVKEVTARYLHVSVEMQDAKVLVRFQDSGSGVDSPDRLFHPFQQSAAGSGLGLYISRFIVRSYGGEIWYEPDMTETCFVVELDAA